MDFLSELWMPIVISAVIVWIASFALHMFLPHHKGEWKAFPSEAGVMAALRGVAAGQYMFPWVNMADMKDPAAQAKLKQGPCGAITIWAGPVNMGRNLLLTFTLYLVVGLFTAYLGWHAMHGEPVKYMDVFRICGTAAFMAHAFGWMSHMIWFQMRGFWTYLFDSLVYGLLTAGVFGWLWPMAAG